MERRLKVSNALRWDGYALKQEVGSSLCFILGLRIHSTLHLTAVNNRALIGSRMGGVRGLRARARALRSRVIPHARGTLRLLASDVIWSVAKLNITCICTYLWTVRHGRKCLVLLYELSTSFEMTADSLRGINLAMTCQPTSSSLYKHMLNLVTWLAREIKCVVMWHLFSLIMLWQLSLNNCFSEGFQGISLPSITHWERPSWL